jgi:hypothetical protein
MRGIIDRFEDAVALRLPMEAYVVGAWFGVILASSIIIGVAMVDSRDQACAEYCFPFVHERKDGICYCADLGDVWHEEGW